MRGSLPVADDIEVEIERRLSEELLHVSSSVDG